MRTDRLGNRNGGFRDGLAAATEQFAGDFPGLEGSFLKLRFSGENRFIATTDTV
ncbi:hypothetical protein [Noviherbaspirillum humi]|uniref:hypothetical protein n=1 Tax=Noviherbaspirillum humi TaxID=1688639 RepID=UPI001595DEC0|nr:hypothetical protein [Noviherbaspirillum humi]